MEEKKKQALILLPSRGAVDMRVFQNLMVTLRESTTPCGYYFRQGESLISRARNELGRLFLEKKEFDYLMWIDDDILWNPNDDLITLLINRGKDIVGGVYSVRDETCRPAIRTKEIQKLVDEKKYGPKDKTIIPKDKVFEVEYLSTGFMLVSRKCMEEIYKNFPYPYQPIYPKGEYLSEDWAFCERARKLGYSIWADTTFELGHLGEHIFTIKDYEETNKD